MSSDLLSPGFAALIDLNLAPHMIAIIVPVAGLIFGGAIAINAMYFQHRRQVMWHELARLALEKGQPIPDLPSDLRGRDACAPEASGSSRSRGYLIGGLINIAVGAGLYVALSQFSQSVAYFSAIPFFIGVALLVGCIVEAVLARRAANTTRQSPLA